jgi:hypothetical protein
MKAIKFERIEVKCNFNQDAWGRLHILLDGKAFGEDDFNYELDDFFLICLRQFEYVSKNENAFLNGMDAIEIVSSWLCSREDYQGDECKKYLSKKDIYDSIDSYAYRGLMYGFGGIGIFIFPSAGGDRIMLYDVDNDLIYESVTKRDMLLFLFRKCAMEKFPLIDWNKSVDNNRLIHNSAS